MGALADIREALAVQVRTLDSGPQAYNYAPGRVNVPAVIIAPDSIEYDVDAEHGATYRLPVNVLVGLGDSESAAATLDELVAHDSALVAALNDCPAFDVQVIGLLTYGKVTYETVEYLGAELIVEVFT